ncbi:MAG TPA: ABC transporter permease [Puia sp.]|nr:ABC transporter permease [Puia sp.]
MYKNFFKSTFRNLWKNKIYSFLNIFGLAVGIACTGLIFLWVEDEVTFDSVNVKKDRLYMALNNWPFAEHYSTFESTPGLMAPAMKAEIPGIVNACRITDGNDNLLFTIDNRSMYAAGKYADSSIFSMFTMPFVQGNPKNAFKQLYSMVITEKTAKKFFANDKEVLGKTIRVDNKKDYTITGVLKDFPENTSIQFEWLAPFEIHFKENPWLSNWGSNSILTIAEVDGKTSLASINKQLYGFIKKRVPASIVSSFLFSMNDWHLRENFENGKQTGKGRIQYVRMFIIIAWIILFLACINFMNLATARSEKRAKEVGVRKVLGSGKNRLITQFIGEALFMAFLAVIVSMILMAFALPLFNTISQKNLSLNFLNPLHLVALAAIAIVCGLIAGSYPSLYLSSFNPIFVLKGIKLKTGSAGLIRKGLVILQFTVSIVLIISTVIIFQQIQHVKSRELGYNKDNLMVMNVQGDMGKNFNIIKQDLLNTGIVVNAALTDHETIYGGNNSNDFSWEGKDVNAQIIISQRYVSPELLSTCGIKIIEGRDFNSNPTTDTSNIIITETLAKMMNTQHVIGQFIREGTSNYKIVGVTKDFVYGDMYGKSDPLIFFCEPHYENESSMYVRLKRDKDPEQAIVKIQEIMKKDNPSYPFDYKFVDDEFNQMFQSEMLVNKLSRVFATLAIIISCLGLFGLAAYTAERRTKEFGIRKVLGASVTNLAGLLSAEFIKLIIISLLLAFPLAWYVMFTWLQSYAYRVAISWWVFAASGMVATLIAIITISFQAIKASIANPVKSLRSE